MNSKHIWIQRAAFFFMLVTALLIIPAIMLNAVIGLLFDAPGSENNVTLVTLSAAWLSLPLFLGVAAYRFLRVVMSPDIRKFVVAMAIGLAPISIIIICAYVFLGG